MNDVLSRHQRIALQLSGGKDSVACLHLLREHLDQITVYWLNTGDAAPETIAVIDACKALATHFVEVNSDVVTWRDTHGWPSDVVPTQCTASAGLAGQQAQPRFVDRYACCEHNMMVPLHQRMVDDGITLIIRGQRRDDAYKSAVRSGDVLDGFEFLFPIEDWTAEQVADYLATEGAPLHEIYQTSATGLDCLHCTAWWDHRREAFLQDHHPQVLQFYRDAREIIHAEVVRAMTPHLNDEV